MAAPQRLGSKSARDQVLSEDRSRLAKNCREEDALRKKPQLSSVSDDEFAQVVRLAPLVSIDLVTRNANGACAGRIAEQRTRKGRLFCSGRPHSQLKLSRCAFTRIVQAETGCRAQIENARFLGVFQHFYAESMAMEHMLIPKCTFEALTCAQIFMNLKGPCIT